MRTGEIIYPSCSTCRYLIRIKVKKRKERTDNGGINFKYLYDWTVECKKEGTIKETIEGHAHRTPIPKCSLWRSMYE